MIKEGRLPLLLYLDRDDCDGIVGISCEVDA